MPLGLAHAQHMRTFFDTPVFATLGAGVPTGTAYHLFTTVVPIEWSSIHDVIEAHGPSLLLRGASDQRLEIPASYAL
jgi:hypothetical protein